jgi:hypothetical protein
MEWLCDEYGIRHFHLTDSEANLPFSRVTSLAGELVKRDLGTSLTWAMYATPQPFDLAATHLLFASGLRLVKLSVDHFASEQLRCLGRAHSETSIHKTLQGLRHMEPRLGVSASVLFGAPGESDATIAYAVRHMRNYAVAGVEFYYNTGIRLYPGTRFFEQWESGALEAARCYGDGLRDRGISPLVYCSPTEPRTLARHIASEVQGYDNIRSLGPPQDPRLDSAFRMLAVAAMSWRRGDLKSAQLALANIPLEAHNGRESVRAALQYEREHRTRQARRWQ